MVIPFFICGIDVSFNSGVLFNRLSFCYNTFNQINKINTFIASVNNIYSFNGWAKSSSFASI